MLKQPQKPVVPRELGGLDPADVPLLGKRAEGAERGDLAHRGVGLPVHQLEQLDGELDVAQSARPELELHVEFIHGDVLRHALAHALHRVDEVLPGCTGPHLGRDAVDIALPEFEVPGQWAGFQEGLELPTLRPAVVVGEVRLESAHQGAILALRPQVRVDLPEPWF